MRSRSPDSTPPGATNAQSERRGSLLSGSGRDLPLSVRNNGALEGQEYREKSYNESIKNAVELNGGIGVARNSRKAYGRCGQDGQAYTPREWSRSGRAQRPMATLVAPQIFVMIVFCLYQANGSRMVSTLMSNSTVANGQILPSRMAL